MLGSLLETFVFNELLKIANNTIIDGEAIGIEVKAGQTASNKHFSNLKKLAKYTPLKAGIVIYTGEDFLVFGKNLFADPVAALFQ